MKSQNIINIIKGENLIIPSYLLNNYKKLSLNEKELLFLSYLTSIGEKVLFDIEKISNRLNLEIPEIMEIISDEMKEYFKGEIDFAFTSPRWIEGMPAGISKGSAIKVIAEKEGINLDEVIAFGDGENDISMLEVAGTAVAMENAMESVKAHADIIALNNLEDGVAIILEKLLK